MDMNRARIRRKRVRTEPKSDANRAKQKPDPFSGVMNSPMNFNEFQRFLGNLHETFLLLRVMKHSISFNGFQCVFGEPHLHCVVAAFGCHI